MNNAIIQLKIKQRLNKLASDDYDNLECWQIVEAFNKGQSNWCRRNLHGLNVKQQGDEQSKAKIDDLQILLKDTVINLTVESLFEESDPLPPDYFEWKRVAAEAKDECCDNPHRLKIYLTEEANIDELLNDQHKKPSYQWGETFCTLKGNRIKIFTNDEFTIGECTLIYYRQPRNIQIQGCVDPYTQVLSPVNIECEFKDDLTELFIDEAVKILAGDIESLNQQQTASGQVEGNN